MGLHSESFFWEKTQLIWYGALLYVVELLCILCCIMSHCCCSSWSVQEAGWRLPFQAQECCQLGAPGLRRIQWCKCQWKNIPRTPYCHIVVIPLPHNIRFDLILLSILSHLFSEFLNPLLCCFQIALSTPLQVKEGYHFGISWDQGGVIPFKKNKEVVISYRIITSWKWLRLVIIWNVWCK